MSGIWDEIKNYPNLKPYVYGLKKEYEDKIKKLEKENADLKDFIKEIKERVNEFEYDVNQQSFIQPKIDNFLLSKN